MNTTIMTTATPIATPAAIISMEDSFSGEGERVGLDEGETVGEGEGLADGEDVGVTEGVAVGSSVAVEVGTGERVGDGSPKPNM